MNDFKQNILNKIKTGEVDMKPRWHFLLQSLLLVLGVFTAALLVVYLASFVLFALRQSGVGFVPLYGFRGISIFIMSTPWILIASAGALVVVLQVLVHKYSFSYRQPLLYSLLGVIALVLLGSFVIGKSQVHERLQEIETERGVPLLGQLYKGIEERRPENIMVGTIAEVTSNGFVLTSDQEETLTVLVSPDTRQRNDSGYEVGLEVLVFGERVGAAEVRALGVRPAPPETRRFLPNRPQNREETLRDRLTIPEEALAACAEVRVGEKCMFTAVRGEVEGVCAATRQGDACVPQL